MFNLFNLYQISIRQSCIFVNLYNYKVFYESILLGIYWIKRYCARYYVSYVFYR